MSFIIKRKVLIAMLFTSLSLLGYYSYKRLPVELIPNAQLPFLFVQVGSSIEVDPRYMESQAIIPLEGAIGTLEGVDKIESNAGQRQGSIRISYQPDANIKFAYLKLAEKVDEVKRTLPQGFFVQVFKFDLEQINNMFMTIQARGSGGVDRVRQMVDKEILNPLKNIDGIANAQVFGGREKSIEIRLDEEVLKSHGLSPADVRTAINQNQMSRTFAGKVNEHNQIYFVNVVSEFKDINDLYELVVLQKGPVKLKDIADIHYGVKEEVSYSRVNGKESVTIELTRDAQANIINLSNEVIKRIDQFNNELAEKDLELVVEFNSAETMEKNIDLIINLALVGGVLAIFILWIFLKNFRLVVAVALAIPISVYTAFNFFYAFDISINTLTLLGMALAIGMLLDNSVVVLENIYRLAGKKVNPDQAVIQGTKEVWRSIFAATLTTITVFLPFVFSTNFFISLLGKHIGVSIISTLLVSLVVALLLIPMITHAFLKKRNPLKPIRFESISYHNRLIQIYRVLLKTCMRNPGKTIMGALGIFFLTLIISLGVSAISSQEAELTEMKLYVTLPSGTTLANTDLIVREVENKLVDLEEKKDIISQVYEEEAIITISLVEDFKKIRNYSVPGIKNEIIDKLEELRQAEFSWDPPATGQRFGSGGFENDDGFSRMLGIGTQQEKVVIKGQDFDRMLDLAKDVEYYLKQLNSMERVRINTPAKRPELMLSFDKQLMSLFDIPITSVLSELNSFPKEFSSGIIFKQGTDEYDIQIITELTEKQKSRNVYDLKHLNVKNSQNARFEIQNISEFNFTEGLSTINRTNQEKQLTLRYEFISEVSDDNDLLNASRIEVDELIASINLPSDIAVEVIHEENDLGEFGFLLTMAFILIFMILASVFESFSVPFVMMFSIPMAGIGSLIALVLTGTSIMNANVFIGFLILLGIVVNNGIIMIDYTRVLQKRGYSESRAMMMAGLARVRPILITAITTIIALIPLALGKAEFVTQIGVPFAITVIGGLAVSTLLTLVFIPTVNSGLQTSLKWIRSQSILIKAILIIIWSGGSIYIFLEVDSRIWQIIEFILLIILVPATIYFIKHSLRQANEKLIDSKTPLRIEIRNLVKIYDWDSRFVREWKSGLKTRKRLGLDKEISSIKDLDGLMWQLPLIGFAIYFIYFHLESGFWFFILPVALYIMLTGMLKPLRLYTTHLKEAEKKKWMRRLLFTCLGLVRWLFPLIALVIIFNKYELLGLIIPFGFFWYLAILIKVTSDKIYKEKININRITGRFKGIRKAFSRFVLIIPIIGKKKTPFKAVKGVSFNIEHGMFGLLGPNGAGKSTLMRIICGILDQSYGQITINGIDVREKREELQSLIGYLPQEFGMYENMTAWEFLHYMGLLKKLHNTEERNKRVEYVLNAVHMWDSRDTKIGSFSGGMKQRIGIAQILLHLPRILVVDEPTAGLDPRERIRFRNLLVELSKERIVIFSTHIIEDVASSCNHVAVMKSGYLQYLGKPIEMAKIAEGKIWNLQLHHQEFDKIKDSLKIIHHMRDGETIRMRCLSNKQPHAAANLVKANLEDAYLCLLHQEDKIE